MKQVILNADDFGKSPNRNRAIDDCFRLGLISSAGLIVTGKHLKDAVEYINKGGYAGKIHLTKKHMFDNYKIIELYCHPNYKDGVFLDDST